MLRMTFFSIFTSCASFFARSGPNAPAVDLRNAWPTPQGRAKVSLRPRNISSTRIVRRGSSSEKQLSSCLGKIMQNDERQRLKSTIPCRNRKAKEARRFKTSEPSLAERWPANRRIAGSQDRSRAAGWHTREGQRRLECIVSSSALRKRTHQHCSCRRNDLTLWMRLGEVGSGFGKL